MNGDYRIKVHQSHLHFGNLFWMNEQKSHLKKSTINCSVSSSVFNIKTFIDRSQSEKFCSRWCNWGKSERNTLVVRETELSEDHVTITLNPAKKKMYCETPFKSWLKQASKRKLRILILWLENYPHIYNRLDQVIEEFIQIGIEYACPGNKMLLQVTIFL